MKEQQLLSAMIQSRTSHDTFQRLGNRDDFGPLATTVLEAVGRYYADDADARSIDRDFLQGKLERAMQSDKHVGAIRSFIEGIPRELSSIAVDRELRELHRERVGGKLALALANGSPVEEVDRLISDYQSAKVLGNEAFAQSSEVISVLDTTDLESEDGEVSYIKLWPRALNDQLGGGALRGNHVLLFARPETGKTLFACNLVVGFLRQGLNVLYVGNEEPGADVRDRIRGRLLGSSKQGVRTDRKGSGSRIQSLSGQLGTVEIIETASFERVHSHLGKKGREDVRASWDVVVLDQVRNMRLNSDGRTAELEAAGIAARALAKERNVLVVSVTQAGDSASGKVYPGMSDIDSSKTGLPASADLIIGLGQDEPMKANGLIGVYLSKNKLSGLHSKFVVEVDYNTGTIK